MFAAYVVSLSFKLRNGQMGFGKEKTNNFYNWKLKFNCERLKFFLKFTGFRHNDIMNIKVIMNLNVGVCTFAPS
jgi:hypothetical protein